MPRRPRLLGLAVLLTVLAGVASTRLPTSAATLVFALAILISFAALMQEVQRWRQ